MINQWSNPKSINAMGGLLSFCNIGNLVNGFLYNVIDAFLETYFTV